VQQKLWQHSMRAKLRRTSLLGTVQEEFTTGDKERKRLAGFVDFVMAV
jgi:hypothetical protein